MRLQRYPEAVENLETYLAKKPDVSNASAVREEIARIKHDHFPGRVHVSANVQNAHISIDGTERGATPLDLSLTPGPHTVRFTADGYDGSVVDIAVVGDADLAVTGTLSQIQVKPPIVDAPPPTAAPLSPFPWKTVGYVTAGVGVAALGTAFVLDMTALKDKTDQFKTERDAGRSDAVQLKSDTLSLRTGVIATYVAGGVLAAGGIALVLFMPRANSSTPKSGSLRFDVDPLAKSASFSGTF
jgi:hypothetical protein